MINAVDSIGFVRQWIARPRQTGAIWPSGNDLAQLMVRDVDPDHDRVIELGGGTGAFTSALLKLGVADDRIEVIEINPDFAVRLCRRFPRVTIHKANAAALDQVVRHPPGVYDCVISGLPLLAVDRPVRIAIIAQAFRLLGPSGKMVQFSYSPRFPLRRSELADLGLQAKKVGTCPRNFPPAYVFHLTRIA